MKIHLSLLCFQCQNYFYEFCQELNKFGYLAKYLMLMMNLLNFYNFIIGNLNYKKDTNF